MAFGLFMIRAFIVFALFVLVKWIGRISFLYRGEWVNSRPHTRWRDIRVLVFLNHTSLYEPLFAGFAPYGLLWRFAFHGVLPVAEKTIKRRIGLFFRFMARHVVTVTRQRDHTWNEVLNRIGRRAIVIIMPEGRMMRRDGRDSTGREMTVRGGIAEILKPLDDGEILVVYSGGLHHGDRLPRPVRNVRARLELIAIREYKRIFFVGDDMASIKNAVIRDFTRRRDSYCPVLENGGVRGGNPPKWRGWYTESDGN
jgi:hypothetical protein